VFYFRNELVDDIKIYEPWGSSDHNQIHFSIKIQTGNTGKWMKNVYKGRHKQMRRIIWTNSIKDKTTTECWIVLKDEIDGIIERFVPMKIKGSDV